MAMVSCSIEACEYPRRALGYCSKHYTRFRKYGNPLMSARIDHDADDVQRLQANIRETDAAKCWGWQGTILAKGYGRVRGPHRRLRLAHRVSYESWIGPIPENMVVCHRCDNRSCVNPSHLFLGTSADNAQDAVQKGRHSHGERHYGTRYSDELIAEVRELAAQGVPRKELSVRTGMSVSYLRRVLVGQARKRETVWVPEHSEHSY